MRCPACRIEITETARAIMPKEIPVKMIVGVCPKCGCENYEEMDPT